MHSIRPIGISFAAIVDSYLTENGLWYDTDDGLQDYVVSIGVPQSSVLGPLLWNIMCNEALNLPLPREATVMGYGDDIALVVVAKYLEDTELYSNEAISASKSWVESSGLTLAEETGRMTCSLRVLGDFALITPWLCEEPCLRSLLAWPPLEVTRFNAGVVHSGNFAARVVWVKARH